MVVLARVAFEPGIHPDTARPGRLHNQSYLPSGALRQDD